MDIKQWQEQTEALKKIQKIVEKTLGLKWGLIESCWERENLPPLGAVISCMQDQVISMKIYRKDIAHGSEINLD